MVARHGFSLAEVVVAIALLSIVAVGVASSGVVAARMFTRAELHERALREADAVLDSLLLLRSNGAGAKMVQQTRLTWSAADSLGTIDLLVHLPTRTILLKARR